MTCSRRPITIPRRSAFPVIVLAMIAAGSGAARADDASPSGPSFDCALAATLDERAICGDETLARLERIAASGFAFVRSTRGVADARAIGVPTLVARHACGADAACIVAVERQAIEAYFRLGAGLSATPAERQARLSEGALPERVGECVTTRIARIAPRLEGADYDSGTAVVFTNGGVQVSYDPEQGIIRSKPGDPVEICLVSLPGDCPPGDDRGRVYVTGNLTSGAVWVLPDSSHICGGA